MAKRSKGPVSYAVVGLGHIAQVAMLPAFAHARRNSRLAALVSDDPTKRRETREALPARPAFAYDRIRGVPGAGRCRLHRAAELDARGVRHSRGAAPGVHVLCEKPMAVTADECERMIEACREAPRQADGGVSAALRRRSTWRRSTWCAAAGSASRSSSTRRSR